MGVRLLWELRVETEGSVCLPLGSRRGQNLLVTVLPLSGQAVPHTRPPSPSHLCISFGGEGQLSPGQACSDSGPAASVQQGPQVRCDDEMIAQRGSLS